ncbi:MAG: quinone oxidoreductase [Myxococcales bacterium]|nr:quinone oxidoreductase [Myxococcales bacterium]
MTTTRAVRFHETGGPEVLRLEQITVPAPGPGEVLLRHEAIGVNFIDTYHRTGLYPVPLPSGIGVEGAGVIEAAGADVQGFAVGDRVAYANGPLGGYAEVRVLPARLLVPIPASLPAKTVAATLLKGMTAEYLVRRTLAVKPGDRVLFHAAAGGVGLLACQWLRALGAHVIGTVGSDEKVAVAREAGCEHVIVYTREDFVARTKELTEGRGVAVVYDSVGKDTFDGSLACLAPRGMLVGFGNASGKPPAFDPMRLAAGSFFFTRAVLGHYTSTREELLGSAGAFLEKVVEGSIGVRPPAEFSLAAAADAHRSLASRATIGSTILLP